jgi:hypothetical protein
VTQPEYILLAEFASIRLLLLIIVFWDSNDIVVLRIHLYTGVNSTSATERVNNNIEVDIPICKFSLSTRQIFI